MVRLDRSIERFVASPITMIHVGFRRVFASLQLSSIPLRHFSLNLVALGSLGDRPWSCYDNKIS